MVLTIDDTRESLLEGKRRRLTEIESPTVQKTPFRVRQTLNVDKPSTIQFRRPIEVGLDDSVLFKKAINPNLEPDAIDVLIDETEKVIENVKTVILETEKQNCYSKKKKYAILGGALLAGYLIGKNV